MGDAIVYGQRKRECLSDLVEETLEEMELHGGESAFINIRCVVSWVGEREGASYRSSQATTRPPDAMRRYMVPTYTSVVFS